ncbi:MAG TPA: 2-oxoacid:acceptor oxidoreductase subunit alpha [Dehalococcoidia bacterium]|nr:2-oxoacid:acceptor oxidoreductase subunit alpha [Dehalococcoidia bacterium]
MTSSKDHLDDVNIIVSGQGGDGSLTVSTILSDLLRERGYNIYTERDVASRIKGGVATASLRASRESRHVRSDDVQLMVSFDAEGVEKVKDQLADDAFIVFDDSDGRLPEGAVPASARLHAAPFGKIAVRQLGRTLYKNSIAVAFATRALAIEDDEVRSSFERRFRRMGQAIVDQNLQALQVGFDLADKMGISADVPMARLSAKGQNKQIQITGNEAVCLGFVAAGGRFFAGYPITPASELLATLESWMPRLGGIAWQAEDELAAVNMAIGASITGVRVMTGTSGPGLALMQEGIGHAGAAEIPLVIVDAQRAGPSTGLPTKPEQSDLDLMLYGGNGDFPRMVLAPGEPGDCFELAVKATNLAEKYQCPVYLALDQGLSQNLATVDEFDLDSVVIDRGKILSEEDLVSMDVFQRYALTDDGVSPYTTPGTQSGFFLLTGNERDEFGRVTTSSANRVRMMDKRMAKLDSALSELPTGRFIGDPNAKVGLIGIGSAYGTLVDALEKLSAYGLNAQLLQPRTLFPMLPETIEFITNSDRVYVVEHNQTGQLAGLLIREGAERNRVRSVIRYDGTPLRPGDIAAEILEKEAQS